MAFAGLLAQFKDCVSPDAVLWLQLAGGFANRSALSLYTDGGFVVTSLEKSQKIPVLSMQASEIGERAHRRMVATLLQINRAARGGVGEDGGVLVRMYIIYYYIIKLLPFPSFTVII